ncbi:MAG: hypothetical protein WBG50_11315 [Desulfomonilaceae bacterium]
MKKVYPLLGAAFILVGSLAFGESQPIKGEVRSPSGKLLYKTYTRGSVTETREPSGRLVTKSKTVNGTTEVRSPTGKLLYKLK